MTNTSGPGPSAASAPSAAADGTSADPSADPAAGRSAAAGAAYVDTEGQERLAKAVRAAEQALIEFEIAVETFRVEVENFSRLHHQRLGPMYARLDELDALIAEAVAAHSGDRADIERAWEARALVMPMPGVEELFGGLLGADGVRPVEDPNPPRRVRPGKEAQRLYRELVRKAHPDLAQDDAEKERRSGFIARVNEAYAYADEAGLRELAAEWDAGPVPVADLPSEAEVLYARLEWLAERKEKLAALAAELDESAIGQMMKLAPDDPDALLNEIAEQLLTQVSQREARLAELVHGAAGG
ncbi:J domain-containing protein [Actinacidiphila sp. bgisy145]|uniref:J domain-containing protein n=1 Tax=Actinacidiphila sp. bgisy145 TaxID=3413792 RepID=UPI003EBBDBD0